MRGSGIEVGYEVVGRERELPGAVGAAVFRIVQEALTNTVKHASARTASVQLRYGEADLHIEVTDDGRGPQAGYGGGHGLIGVRERAAAQGARPSPGRGRAGAGSRCGCGYPYRLWCRRRRWGVDDPGGRGR